MWKIQIWPAVGRCPTQTEAYMLLITPFWLTYSLSVSRLPSIPRINVNTLYSIKLKSQPHSQFFSSLARGLKFAPQLTCNPIPSIGRLPNMSARRCTASQITPHHFTTWKHITSHHIVSVKAHHIISLGLTTCKISHISSHHTSRQVTHHITSHHPASHEAHHSSFIHWNWIPLLCAGAYHNYACSVDNNIRLIWSLELRMTLRS